MQNPLAGDLNHVLTHTEGLWDELRGQRVFITGGTGFLGCWLLESFLWANDELGLNASVVVLTRHKEAFRRKAPHLADHSSLQLHEGDVRSFDFPAGAFSHVIHAATDASSTLNDHDPLLMFETIVTGTRRTLELARRCDARRFLLTSSGAVYGPQPADVTHISEDYGGGPDATHPRSAYAEGKRAAELLCAAYARQHGLQPTIARCFAFVGPYLPLDIHFAVGNFIRDALGGGPIHVKGDGSPYRSYLYAADLTIWLWTILLRGGAMRPYNVGSPEELTIQDVARIVSEAFVPAVPIQVARLPIAGMPAERYVPAVTRANSELGLKVTVPLRDAIRRTIAWHTSSERASSDDTSMKLQGHLS
jgi:nucleoside-diphosphate-sugar epimerase